MFCTRTSGFGLAVEAIAVVDGVQSGVGSIPPGLAGILAPRQYPGTEFWARVAQTKTCAVYIPVGIPFMAARGPMFAALIVQGVWRVAALGTGTRLAQPPEKAFVRKSSAICWPPTAGGSGASSPIPVAEVK